MKRRLRDSISLGLVVLAASAASSRAQTQPGFTYTVRVTSDRPGGMMPGVTGAATTDGYSGRAFVTARRGRLDIMTGAVADLLSKGDYILFDSTTMVLVRPSEKRFMVMGPELSLHDLKQLDALGMTLKLSDEKVVLDSLGAGDTISGTPTKRYRLTVAFNLTMNASVAIQRLGSETIIDYWVATIPGLPPNPLLRPNGLASGLSNSMFKSLSDRVDSVSRRMGQTTALRTITTARFNEGPGQVVQTKQTSEVSDIRRADVDVSRLVIPAAYTSVPYPGTQNTAGDGAKWKAPPPA